MYSILAGLIATLLRSMNSTYKVCGKFENGNANFEKKQKPVQEKLPQEVAVSLPLEGPDEDDPTEET